MGGWPTLLLCSQLSGNTRQRQCQQGKLVNGSFESIDVLRAILVLKQPLNRVLEHRVTMRQYQGSPADAPSVRDIADVRIFFNFKI